LKNSNNKLLSIIIPSYNSEKTIGKCLKSIIEQNKKDWVEIIIINDNSKDKTLSICKNYQKKIGKENFKILSLAKNNGPGFCRNAGIKNSNGNFLAFLDSDDFLLKNSLNILKKIITNKNPDILINNHLRNKKPFTHDLFFKNFKKKILNKNEFLKIFLTEKLNINECWKIIVKREIVKKNKIYFPSIYIGEDQCFVIETMIKSHKIYINKQPIVYHFSSLTGLSSGNFLDMSMVSIFLINYFYNLKCSSNLEKKLIFEKLNYLETSLYINVLNLNDIKAERIFREFFRKFSRTKLNFKKKILYKTIMKNNTKFLIKLNNFLKNCENEDIFIFSNNFLGKSLKKYANQKGINIKYIFDDNSKFKLQKLENYKFNKKKKIKFLIGLLDLQILKLIKIRLKNLKIKNLKILQFI
tara:strand:- start:1280 stop:2515 length:1236 start_codon:yes stop_codon:yes gene_type:complete